MQVRLIKTNDGIHDRTYTNVKVKISDDRWDLHSVTYQWEGCRGYIK